MFQMLAKPFTVALWELPCSEGAHSRQSAKRQALALARPARIRSSVNAAFLKRFATLKPRRFESTSACSFLEKGIEATDQAAQETTGDTKRTASFLLFLRFLFVVLKRHQKNAGCFCLGAQGWSSFLSTRLYFSLCRGFSMLWDTGMGRKLGPKRYQGLGGLVGHCWPQSLIRFGLGAPLNVGGPRKRQVCDIIHSHAVAKFHLISICWSSMETSKSLAMAKEKQLQRLDMLNAYWQ